MSLISVIIPNYQTEDLVIQCINTLCQYHDKKDFEFIVINNGGSLERLESLFGKGFIKIIVSDGNVGFSKANNLGIANSTGDFLLFINSDIIFHDAVIHDCVKELKRNNHIAILGCRLLNADKSVQFSYHDGDRVFRKLLWRFPPVIKWLRGSVLAEKSKQMIVDYHQHSHFVPWLSGAFMLTRRSDIPVDGKLWDEDFFMYWEDVELCYRLRNKGKRIFYYKDKSVIHLGGGGSNTSIDRFKMMEDSKLLWIKKLSPFYLWLYLLMIKVNLRLEYFLIKRKDSISDNTVIQNELEYYKIHSFKVT